MRSIVSSLKSWRSQLRRDIWKGVTFTTVSTSKKPKSDERRCCPGQCAAFGHTPEHRPSAQESRHGSDPDHETDDNGPEKHVLEFKNSVGRAGVTAVTRTEIIRSVWKDICFKWTAWRCASRMPRSCKRCWQARQLKQNLPTSGTRLTSFCRKSTSSSFSLEVPLNSFLSCHKTELQRPQNAGVHGLLVFC